MFKTPRLVQSRERFSLVVSVNVPQSVLNSSQILRLSCSTNQLRASTLSKLDPFANCFTIWLERRERLSCPLFTHQAQRPSSTSTDWFWWLTALLFSREMLASLWSTSVRSNLTCQDVATPLIFSWRCFLLSTPNRQTTRRSWHT